MLCGECANADTARNNKEKKESLKVRIKESQQTKHIKHVRTKSVVTERSQNNKLLLNHPTRTDAYGHPIIKGNKLHKISFIDNVKKESKVAEVLNISSNKKENQNTTTKYLIRTYSSENLKKKKEDTIKNNKDDVGCKACLVF